MMKISFTQSASVCLLLLSAYAHAGYAVGTVGQVMVGRLGNQVFVELLDANFSDWPCGTPHPNGFRYSLLLNQPGGKEMLAAILSAQATGKRLQIVGHGTCSQEPALEDISYVVIQP